MSWTVLTPPLSLKRDTSYACAFSLSLAEKLLATESAVAQKFTDAGFTGISVDMDAKRAEGVWGQPDADNVALPDEVTNVWEWTP